jgi:hypothetical protein
MAEKAFYALKSKDKDAAKAYLHKMQDAYGVERGKGYREVLAAAGTRTTQVDTANRESKVRGWTGTGTGTKRDPYAGVGCMAHAKHERKTSGKVRWYRSAAGTPVAV